MMMTVVKKDRMERKKEKNHSVRLQKYVMAGSVSVEHPSDNRRGE